MSISRVRDETTRVLPGEGKDPRLSSKTIFSYTAEHSGFVSYAMCIAFSLVLSCNHIPIQKCIQWTIVIYFP